MTGEDQDIADQINRAEEYYRDHLVDWMVAHDIATGGAAQGFDELLKVVGTYVTDLKKARESENVE